MPFTDLLPIMPKELKQAGPHTTSASTAPYTLPSTSGQRNAAIWSAADDEILLQARASGLNWQPIAIRHFPNKTANACRKRHERLIERRHVEDWDAQKLELLAQEYMEVRREMWEMLASRVGERWAVIEAKVSYSRGCVTSESASLTSFTVHGKGTQGTPSHGTHSSTTSLCEPQPGHGRTRYSRPQQRLRYRVLRC